MYFTKRVKTICYNTILISLACSLLISCNNSKKDTITGKWILKKETIRERNPTQDEQQLSETAAKDVERGEEYIFNDKGEWSGRTGSMKLAGKYIIKDSFLLMTMMSMPVHGYAIHFISGKEIKLEEEIRSKNNAVFYIKHFEKVE